MDADLKTVLNFNLGYNGFLWNITPSNRYLGSLPRGVTFSVGIGGVGVLDLILLFGVYSCYENFALIESKRPIYKIRQRTF